MYPVKNPKYDLRLKYRKTLEAGLVISLALQILMFKFMPAIGGNGDVQHSKQIEIKVEDIPQTEQIQNLPPPPPRPSVPVPTENEDVPDDLTIETTDIKLDLSKLPPPPELKEDDVSSGYVFIPYDEAPAPIGGFAAIQKNVKYPEIARKSGIEANVIIAVLISETGKPVKTEVMKGTSTNLGFEQAAIDAIMTTQWKPAKQRDRAIKVWVSVPVRFKLNAGTPVS